MFRHLTIAVAALSMAGAASAAAPLPALNIDKTQTSVSGISSGGYMAVQLHVAYSSLFRKGAAVIAGGPYNCAENSVLNGIGRCLGKSAIPVDDLVRLTRQWAGDGAIDPVSNLSTSRAYLFNGANDSVVNPATTAALLTYYQAFLPPAGITYKKDVPAEHAFVTDDFGAACQAKAMPFINNCGFDLAGELLQNLYGTLAPRKSGALDGSLIEFDQAALVAGHGMGTNGFVYVPRSCATGAACRVHVVLHGCRQNATDIGQDYVKNTGYNRWADTNHIVVLYPQTGKGAVNSCWDWWGYDDANYAKKSAPQMKAIVGMIEQLAKGIAPAAAANGKRP
jgi:poly(3-hydroxybutyrate) depolymerase